MSDIKIDSHKLIYHPEAVSHWLKGNNIYPIELEISPNGGCNHRCIFCAVDYMGYQAVKLDKYVLLNNLREIYPKGLKSVIYAGEGEPLLNKDISEIVQGTKSIGIDAAMSSNGVLLNKELAQEILPSLTWIRFSISAATESVYRRIHQCRANDLERVLANLASAVEIKQKNSLSVTLGAQMLLMNDNKDEAVLLARKLGEIGIDYFTVKPFSYHPKSGHQLVVDYQDMLSIENELKNLENDNYKIYFRSGAMKKLQDERPYDKCYGLPFMSYIDTRGNIWPCIAFMGDPKMCYGNIYEQSFVEIWTSKRKKDIMDLFQKKEFLQENCRELCRLDEINRYLYQLKNPGDHVNFI